MTLGTPLIPRIKGHCLFPAQWDSGRATQLHSSEWGSVVIVCPERGQDSCSEEKIFEGATALNQITGSMGFPAVGCPQQVMGDPNEILSLVEIQL